MFVLCSSTGCGAGLALALIFLLFSAQVCTLALGAGTLALILLQVARAASETVNLEFLRLFGSMLKKEERFLGSVHSTLLPCTR